MINLIIVLLESKCFVNFISKNEIYDDNFIFTL